MADAKISELTAIDAVTGVDLLAVVDDPAGTPATKKATATQLKDFVVGAGSVSVASGKTLTASNTLTLAGTDSTTMTFPSTSATIARTDAANSFTGSQTLESTAELLWSTDLRLTRRNAANLRLGAADAAGSSIAVSAVDTSTERLTVTAHGLTSGAAVQFITTGSLPGGLTAGVTYFARVIDADTIEVYTTFAGATAASGTTDRVNLTSAGSNSSCQRAAPFQTLSVQNFTGTNIPGQPLVITGSQGTGTGAGGSIIFQVAPAGTTGTAQNALSTALTINGAGHLLIPGGSATSIPLQFSSAGLGWSTLLGGNNIGISRISSQTTVFRVDVNGTVGTPGSFRIGTIGSEDVILLRDAANTLAQRNDTNAQESRVYGSFASATNFQRLSIKTLREVSTTLSGATYVSTIAIPAYAVLIGVTTRVNTAITGATTYDVGDGTDVDLWGAAIPVALNSESRTANFTAVAATGAAATSRTVTLTANGSNFTGGVVEICLHYLTTEAD